jgi:diacylglycerol kinase family enzyme
MVNPKSGLPQSFTALRQALEQYWDLPGTELTYQFLQSTADGSAKAARAVKDGVDTILVAGGDGTINAVGQVLVGTDVTLGVLPAGSGNGFARHFEIPLSPAKAAQALANAETRLIDVGVANDEKFFVTCSMAWDAAFVRSFQKSPIRGVLPYVFAGVNEFFQYTPQQICVSLDSGEEFCFEDVLEGRRRLSRARCGAAPGHSHADSQSASPFRWLNGYASRGDHAQVQDNDGQAQVPRGDPD